MMTFFSGSENETVEYGKWLGSALEPGAVVALRGGLGAGKTAFTRGIALALGVTERVTSPTFTIVNEYEGRLPLFHFDMYRLDSGGGVSGELFELGWDEYLERGGVVVVEWSEHIFAQLPPGAIIVEITRTGDTTREIEIPEEYAWA